MALHIRKLLRDVGTAWQEDNVPNGAAAISFYTMMSLGPLVFLILSVAGLAFGLEAAHGAMLRQADQLMGAEGARLVGDVVRASPVPEGGPLRFTLGALTLLFGATGVFAALQDAMDEVWHVRPKSDAGVRFWLKKRFLSASMVFGLGFLLIVSLSLDGLLAALWGQMSGPEATLAPVLEFLLSTSLGTALLFGAFQVLPDVRLHARTACIGAATTAVLLNVGKTALGIYLGRSGVAQTFGAAGSLALVLVWVYYAAQIVLLGAAFTRALAMQLGEPVEPNDDAVAVHKVTSG